MLETPIVDLLPQVLQWVNKQRALQGRKPLTRMPKGVPGDPKYCPIANALNGEFDVNIGTSSASFKIKGGAHHEASLPAPCRSFITRFDSGEIPKLLDNALAERRMAERKVEALESEIKSYSGVVAVRSDEYINERASKEASLYGDTSGERVRRQLLHERDSYAGHIKDRKAKLVTARAELAKFST